MTKRVLLINVWQPIKNPLDDRPQQIGSAFLKEKKRGKK